METSISKPTEFARLKECVRIGVIRRLDGPQIRNIESQTLRREVRVLAEALLEDQRPINIPHGEQQQLFDEVADEICVAGIQGLSESLWDQSTDLPYRVIRSAIPVALILFTAVWFYPVDLSILRF